MTTSPLSWLPLPSPADRAEDEPASGSDDQALDPVQLAALHRGRDAGEAAAAWARTHAAAASPASAARCSAASSAARCTGSSPSCASASSWARECSGSADSGEVVIPGATAAGSGRSRAAAGASSAAARLHEQRPLV
ncbi:hypothetical protein ACIRYZ_36470 [Kitasatospora sp. NPDC101155]|uniref:hypothetical protein n=1 Tax=Kitasatospora sp. NPDC101155 TaxID=3364097 RepID=UPI0037F34CC8